MLYVGDSIFKYLRINRFGSTVRFSSGARVEQLPEGLHSVGTSQVRGFSFPMSFAVCTCKVYGQNLLLFLRDIQILPFFSDINICS